MVNWLTRLVNWLTRLQVEPLIIAVVGENDGDCEHLSAVPMTVRLLLLLCLRVCVCVCVV